MYLVGDRTVGASFRTTKVFQCHHGCMTVLNNRYLFLSGEKGTTAIIDASYPLSLFNPCLKNAGCTFFPTLYMSVFKISQQISYHGLVIEVLLSYEVLILSHPDHIYVVYVVLGLGQHVEGLNLVIKLVPGGFSRLLLPF